jgi:3-phenylpropionate/trans-cinnamate dioxygenase ferredoxin component
MSKRFVTVGREDEIPEGETRLFEFGDLVVVVGRYQGVLYAVDGLCTHDESPLESGKLIGAEIECPRHGARFDICTGRVCQMPAAAPLESYPVRVEDGKVQVEVED